MPIHNTQEMHSFFDHLISGLGRAGTFRTYDKPLGTALPYHALKHGHADPVKDTTGLIHHVGDVPYHGSTTTLLQSYELPAAQELLTLKSNSIRRAIDACMPDFAFTEFLAYYRENLNLPEFRSAFKESLDELVVQLSEEDLPHNIRPLDTPIKKSLDRGDHHSKMLHDLSEADVLQHLDKHPTLVTALAIYHAAHKVYCDELLNAVGRNTTLDADQRDNLTFAVSNTSFQQFRVFLLFVSMLPLSLYEYSKNDAPAEGGWKPWTQRQTRATEATDHTAMRNAITRAWDTFFERNLTIRQYKEGNYEPPVNGEKVALAMTCPAKAHLKQAQQGGLIEQTYDFIRANPDKSRSALELAERITSRIARDSAFARS